MHSQGSVFPLLPGKTEAWRQFCREMMGARRQAYEASRRRLGISRERAYLQQTPMGDMAVTYHESDKEFAHVIQAIATSKDPFDVWFVRMVLELHGVDFTQPPPGPPPETGVEWNAS